MNELKLFDETRSTPVHSTIYTDGMVVNADDLDDAMRYPLELIQVLIRAYFGCGIVCGLVIKQHLEGGEEDTYCIKIEPGVALDCRGYPLQIEKEVIIDLTPDPCIEPMDEPCFCIAIGRETIEEAPRKGDGECDDNKTQYARRRELVRIRVFHMKNDGNGYWEGLPGNICACNDNPGCDDGTHNDDQECYGVDRRCLEECPPACCGEAWVLLGCVKLGECGVEELDDSCRKYIKPIDCLCPITPQVTSPASKPPNPPEPRPENPIRKKRQSGRSKPSHATTPVATKQEGV